MASNNMVVHLVAPGGLVVRSHHNSDYLNIYIIIIVYDIGPTYIAL